MRTLWIAALGLGVACPAPKAPAPTGGVDSPTKTGGTTQDVALSPAQLAWLGQQSIKGPVLDPRHNEFPATGSGLLDPDGMSPGPNGDEYWAVVFHSGTTHYGDLLGTSGQSDVAALAGFRYGTRWDPNVGAFPPSFRIEPVAQLGLPGTNDHPDLPFLRDPGVLAAPWTAYEWQRQPVAAAPAAITPGSGDRVFRLDFADSEVGYLVVGPAQDRMEWYLTTPRWWPHPSADPLHDLRVSAVATEVSGPVTLTGTYFLRVDQAL